MTVARLTGRGRGFHRPRGFSFRVAGVALRWSGGVWQGCDPGPGGGYGICPGPAGGDFQPPAAAAADQLPGRMQDPVTSLNLEMIMVLGEADGGLRRA